MSGFSGKVAGLIIARDQGACAFPGCGKHVTHLERGSGFGYALHHRRPKGMGGSGVSWINEPANGVVLCEEHHRAVHADPEGSYSSGFLVKRGIQRADEVSIRHGLYGLVLLTDDGGVVPVEVGPTPESLEGDETWA